MADREFHRPEVLDKARPRHSQSLGRQKILAVVAKDVPAVGRDSVALPQMQVFQNAAIPNARPLDIPAADATAP